MGPQWARRLRPSYFFISQGPLHLILKPMCVSLAYVSVLHTQSCPSDHQFQHQVTSPMPTWTYSCGACLFVRWARTLHQTNRPVHHRASRGSLQSLIPPHTNPHSRVPTHNSATCSRVRCLMSHLTVSHTFAPTRNSTQTQSWCRGILRLDSGLKVEVALLSEPGRDASLLEYVMASVPAIHDHPGMRASRKL